MIIAGAARCLRRDDAMPRVRRYVRTSGAAAEQERVLRLRAVMRAKERCYYAHDGAAKAPARVIFLRHAR